MSLQTYLERKYDEQADIEAAMEDAITSKLLKELAKELTMRVMVDLPIGSDTVAYLVPCVRDWINDHWSNDQIINMAIELNLIEDTFF